MAQSSPSAPTKLSLAPRPSLDALSPLSDRSMPVEILPKVFLGNLRSSKNRDFLERNGITHILTVGNDIEPEFPKRYKYMLVPVDDSNEDDLSSHFAKCFRFIDSARKDDGAILVHCHAGISRSPSIMIGYLMSRNRLSFADAFKFVKNKDTLIAPNEAFVTQLKALELRVDDIDKDSDAETNL